jgi:hypothetical protein
MSEHADATELIATLSVSGGALDFLPLIDTRFTLNANGELFYTGNLVEIDYENPDGLKTHSLAVQPQCASEHTVLSLEVYDVNEPISSVAATYSSIPTATTATSFTLAENTAVGSVIASVTFVDPDINQGHTVALSANPSSLFSINLSNELVLAAPLDFEALANPVFNVQVLVTDEDYLDSQGATITGGLSKTLVLTVTVTDVNEPPSLVSATFFYGQFSMSNLYIDQIVASDPDSKNAVNGTVLYSIAGASTSTCLVDAYTGEVYALFHETGVHSFECVLTATDGGGLSASATLTIAMDLTTTTSTSV